MQESTYYTVWVDGHAIRLFENLDIAKYYAKEVGWDSDNVEITEENRKVIWRNGYGWKDGEYVE